MADAAYVLDSLQFSGFRAFLMPKTFDFGTKRCLAVFAPNGSGKSSIVDGLEFMFSREGTLERLGVRTIHNNAGVAALAHNLAAEKKIDPLVGVCFKQYAETVARATQRAASNLIETGTSPEEAWNQAIRSVICNSESD